MWMGRTLQSNEEGIHISSQAYGSSSFNGNGYQQNSNSDLPSFASSRKVNEEIKGDWKSRLIENGQWLGEKVMEYGGKITRRSSHSSIPDSSNSKSDGRANWMADIRNSNLSYSSAPSSSGYQNDFFGYRPNEYSDYCERAIRNEKIRERNTPRKTSKKMKKRAKRSSKKHIKSRSKAYSTESSGDETCNRGVVSDSDEISEFEVQNSRTRLSSGTSVSEESSEDSPSTETDDNLIMRNTASKCIESNNYSFTFTPSKMPPPPRRINKKNNKTKEESKKHEIEVERSERFKNRAKENIPKQRKNKMNKINSQPDLLIDLLDFNLKDREDSEQHVRRASSALEELNGIQFLGSGVSRRTNVTNSDGHHTSSSIERASTKAMQFLEGSSDLVNLDALNTAPKKPKQTRDTRTLNEIQLAAGKLEPSTAFQASFSHATFSL